MKYIIGNWKMHGDSAMVRELAEAVAGQAAHAGEDVTVVLCPPATLVGAVANAVTGSRVKIGGQDCHVQPDGAYTGDIGAPMLRDAGASYVIIGHSERRRYHHESDDDVRRKAARAIKSRLIPIICIGETEAQRDAGQAEAVLSEQIRNCIPEEATGHIILAYEPVWAIGTGRTPTFDEIRLMHAHILKVATVRTGLAQSQISVLYGGSVKSTNAKEILSTEGVAGVLVGGASLKAEEFCEIIAAGG